jgi:hypothetical protein
LALMPLTSAAFTTSSRSWRPATDACDIPLSADATRNAAATSRSPAAPSAHPSQLVKARRVACRASGGRARAALAQTKPLSVLERLDEGSPVVMGAGPAVIPGMRSQRDEAGRGRELQSRECIHLCVHNQSSRASLRHRTARSDARKRSASHRRTGLGGLA